MSSNLLRAAAVLSICALPNASIAAPTCSKLLGITFCNDVSKQRPALSSDNEGRSRSAWQASRHPATPDTDIADKAEGAESSEARASGHATETGSERGDTKVKRQAERQEAKKAKKDAAKVEKAERKAAKKAERQAAKKANKDAAKVEKAERKAAKNGS